MTNIIVAATDGSAIRNPNGPAGWAWFVDEHNWACGSFPKASNQVAELFAILALLRAVPADRRLLIRTDSQFAINVLTKWMRGWKAAGWVKADRKPPENLALVKELDKAMQGRVVSFEWVRGHTGDPMNEIADKLCTAASKARLVNKSIPSGPGWSGVLKNAGSAASAGSAGGVKRSVGGSVGGSAAGSRAVAGRGAVGASAGRRRAPVRRKAAVGKVDGAFDWADWDDDSKRVIQPESNAKTIFCDSCNGPINLVTSECRCSFTGGR